MSEPLDANLTNYSVADFVSWQRQGLLDLRPPYQRLSVWTPRAKSLFIDSVLRGYPIPLIFLTNTLDLGRAVSVRQVVDGQQRIRTLLTFIAPDSLPDRTNEDDFVVLKSHNKDYAGQTFQELPARAQTFILETPLPTIVLPSDLPDVEVLRIFQRMNSTGFKLNAQELRNAEFSGEFKDVSYQLAYDQHQRWLRWGLFATKDLARMVEVEFTSDLLGLLLEGVKARTKGSLDKFYKDYDKGVDGVETLTKVFSEIFDVLNGVFGGQRPTTHLGRFRTMPWLYSCFAVASNADCIDLKGYYRADVDPDVVPELPSASALEAALVRCEKTLQSGRQDEDLLKVLRGATSDKTSRERRIKFVRDHLE